MDSHIFKNEPSPALARIQYGTDRLQFGELRLPSGPGPFPVIIVIHGGFWRAKFDLSYIGHASAALTAIGLATWTVEYRRIGNEGGGWPGTFQDLALAADHLRNLARSYPLNLERVAALGHSAGGHLALWLAARSNIGKESPLFSQNPINLKGAIPLAGVLNLRQAWELRLSENVVETFMGGSPSSFPERYSAGSPSELLPLGVTQILVHGTEDKSVPFVISKQYRDLAQSKGDLVELITLPGSGHFEVVDPSSQEWSRVADAALTIV